jgi:hypothetical protein
MNYIDKEKQIKNAPFMIKDLISGDDSVFESPLFADITAEEIQVAVGAIINNSHLTDSQKKFYLNNTWKIHYQGNKPPPTIEEFLTPYYLGDTANSLYPYIKQDLVNFWNPSKPYRNAILAPFIGYGKSTESVISNLFVSTHLMLMRDPKKYFFKAPTTRITQILISFNLDQANDLLLDPFKQILESTDKFEKCRTYDSLLKKNREQGVEKFFWTTSHPTAAITFSNGVNITLASNPSKLLGKNIIMGTMSEISFFIDRGFSQEFVMRIFNDLKNRIYSRFKTKDGKINYWARSILDSSPNDLENAIDRYIWGEAHKDSTNFIIKGSMWDFRPDEFDMSKLFPIFKGDASRQPKIVSTEQSNQYDSSEIIFVPEELKQRFEDDLVKSLKDLAGIPAGKQGKLIPNKEIIEEMFIPSLKNNYSYIEAPHYLPPEKLIWNSVWEIFFIQHGDRYEFWRYPQAVRFISLDQSITGDTTGFSMVHKETDSKGSEIFVVDMTLAVVPNKSRINLDSLVEFVLDLLRIGGIRIGAVSFDRFESESGKQKLLRHGIEVDSLSVDTSTGPYMGLVALMNTHRVKVGRNIFLKNNLKSLIMSKTKTGRPKVDHTFGVLSDVEGASDSWETSGFGLYAKDVSDTVAASISLCQKYTAAMSTNMFLWEENKGEILNGVSVKDHVYKKFGMNLIKT